MVSKFQPPPLNTIYFERAEVNIMPNTGLKKIKFVAKKSSPTVMTLDWELSLNRTYESLFVHIVAYRQFSNNEYRKFLVDVWEDICKAVKGGTGNLLTRIVMEKTRDYTNVVRPCPYTPGIYYTKMKNMQMDTMNFGQILPSGRYRVEGNLTSGFKGTVLLTAKAYYAVSDRRVEQF